MGLSSVRIPASLVLMAVLFVVLDWQSTTIITQSDLDVENLSDTTVAVLIVKPNDKVETNSRDG
jgi:hypothetical protein